MLIRRLYIALCITAGLLISITMPAQSLPQLPRDKRIQTGTLRCGVPYYMVSSQTEKGYADFAIVRAGVDQPSFEGAGFLARSGVNPRRGGYAERHGHSTVLHFDAVPVYDPAVLDSMLLVSFAAVAAADVPQAIIIAGDVDAGEVRKKMDIFSMLVQRRSYAEGASEPYLWHPREAPSLSLRQGKPASLEVTYAAPRVPAAQMNTAQALVTANLGEEFLTIAAHRLERTLQDEGIPYGSVRTALRGSADAGGDERYILEVTTTDSYLQAVEQVLSRTLGALDVYGAGVEEYMDAKKVLYPKMVRSAGETPSNRAFVDRCVAHFLYGADLAPLSERLRFFARKSLSDSTETRLFNNFTAALLDPLENLSLRYRAASDSIDVIEGLVRYYRGYLLGEITRPRTEYTWRADTLGFAQDCPKVKLKSEKQETVSGGLLWTFSNGMRVVYRQMDGLGYFDYALVLPAGLSQIRGLEPGEGGYIGDMLSLYQAGGLPNRNFRDLLTVRGISMDTFVDQNTMTIRGEAPSQGIQLLLKTLLCLANERAFDNRAFEVYARNALETAPSVDERLYGLLNGGEVCAVRKDPKAFSLNTRQKAELLFEDRFSRMNEAVLVLSGDLEAAALKRLLLRYLGGFRTSKVATPRRTLRSPIKTGTVFHEEKTGRQALEIRMETEYALTGVNVHAAEIAAEALRRHLVAVMAPKGFSVEVRAGIASYPQERLWMRVGAYPLHEDPDLVEGMTRLRSALRAAAALPLPPQDLKAWKNRTLARTRAELATPRGTVDKVVMRYGAGKDLVSHYSENIASIEADKVKDMLRSVTSGGRVELMEQ